MAIPPQMTEPTGVFEYLKTFSIQVNKIQRIQTGACNFVYRLFLSHPWRETQEETAILKYSASYIASMPTVSFSSDRQIFEARALTYIPWRQFVYNNIPGSPTVSTCSTIRLPEVYLEDRKNHLTVIQDCSPGINENKGLEQPPHSFAEFCKHIHESPAKHETAQIVGSMLGMFLAQLHAWGRSEFRHQPAFEHFRDNSRAIELMLECTLTDFFKNVKAGCEVNQEQQIAMASHIQDLWHAVDQQQSTVLVNDFWPGNVLLGFDEVNKLSNISIIDWDFVATGPNFLDVGNFIGEIFAISYFERTDSTYATVLDSFIQAYRSLVVSIDTKQILGYAAAVVIRIASDRFRKTKVKVGPCVAQAINIMLDPIFSDLATPKADPFNSLAQLMRNNANANCRQ